MKVNTTNKRKIDRKENRKNKKVKKHESYLKSNSKKFKTDDSQKLVVTKRSKTIAALKQIVEDAKANMKKKKPAKSKEFPNKNEKRSNGLNFKTNSNSRMAALQEFVNNETKASGFNPDKTNNKLKNDKSKKDKSKNDKSKNDKSKNDKNIIPKTKKEKLASIKDKHRITELEKGIKKDDHEISNIQRSLGFNVKQKKSDTMMRNIFGSDIGDIFDALDTEPMESDLLDEENTSLGSAVVPVTDSKRVKKKVQIPENAYIVETSKFGLKGNDKSGSSADDTDEDLSSDDLDASSNWTDASDIESPKVNPSKKRKRPMETAFEDEELDSDEEDNDVPVAQPLKSIIKKSKKPSKKRKSSLNVSFNLGENKIREIPLVSKVSGFKVYGFSDLSLPYTVKNGTVILPKRKAVEEEPEEDDEESDLDMEEEFSDEEEWLDMSQEDIDDDEEDIGSEEGGAEDWHMEAEFTDSDENDDEEMSDNDEQESGQSDAEQELPHSSIVSKSKKQNSLKPKGKQNAVKPKGKLTEDIYGRLRDSEGNIVEEDSVNDTALGDCGPTVGYSCPATRKLDQQLQTQLKSDSMKKVRSQLLGAFSRLSEANLAGNIAMVCGLYEDNPRHLMSVLLSERLLARIASDSAVHVVQMQECAALVAAVSCKVGDEVGGQLLTDFVITWHSGLTNANSSKECLTNLLSFVAYLYTFGIVHAALLFDMLQLLASQVSVANWDQLIAVIGSVGFQLRKDDPLAVRDLILKVQETSAVEDAKDVAKTEVLNTMLRAVKNNNESKMPNYDPSYTDRLRNVLRGYLGSDVVVSPVRVTLEDLLLSETRGRWWVVGSAWTGSSMITSKQAAGNGKPAEQLAQTKYSSSFMKFAKEMRITRAPKINILFILTVGSEDCTDAFAKLKELSLPPEQEELIFYIMFYCVQKLKMYKPFYSSLANLMCESDYKYKKLLQRCIWEKLSDLDGMKIKELKNIGKFVIGIVTSDAMNLSVLKTLPFETANKKMIGFLEGILCQLFDAREGCHVSQYAFKNLFISKKLQPFRVQLKLFINVFILPKLESGEISPENVLFQKRVDTVLQMLAADNAALM